MKALSPILVTEAGMIIPVIFDIKNAESPIVDSTLPLAKVTVVMLDVP